MYADGDETLSIQVLRVRIPQRMRDSDSDAEEALASVKLSLLPLSEYAAADGTRVFKLHVLVHVECNLNLEYIVFYS